MEDLKKLVRQGEEVRFRDKDESILTGIVLRVTSGGFVWIKSDKGLYRRRKDKIKIIRKVGLK
jgi:hypothetical protein